MDTKICFKCEKEKSISEFYKHPEMADGYLNKCKICTKKDSNKHRSDNIEKVKAYDRKRSLLPERIKARQMYYKNNKANTEYKKAQLKSNTKYRENNPKKYKAHNLVAYHLRSGNIKQLPCAICGDINSEAHHEDYDFPLSVIWLCSKHHKEIHKKS